MIRQTFIAGQYQDSPRKNDNTNTICKMYVFDFKFCTKPITIICIVLFTALIGYCNQTDIYEKLNALPDDRNELTPIKKVEFKQQKNSNVFDFNISIQCALKETKINLMNSLKFKVENKQFKQINSVIVNTTALMDKDYISGVIFLHFYGHLNVALMYMYEPIYEQEFDVSPISFIPSNSLISTKEDEDDKHSYSRVCIKNGIVYFFSQHPIISKKKYQSLSKSEIFYHSEIFYNFNDFFQKNPGTAKIGSGNLFAIDIKETKDWFRSVILPLKKRSDIIQNSMNFLLIRNIQENETISLEDLPNTTSLSLQGNYCFNEMNLYHLDPELEITRYLSTYNSRQKYDNGLTVLGKRNDFNEEIIESLQDLCNSTNVTFTESPPKSEDYIPIDTRISLIQGAKCVLTKDNNKDLAALSRGIIIHLSQQKTVNEMPFHINENTRYIQYIQTNQTIDKELMRNGIALSSGLHNRIRIDEKSKNIVDIKESEEL